MSDFTSIQKKIEQRQSEIMKALEEENKAWKLLEQRLKNDIEMSLKSVLSSSIDNMEEQEKRLLKKMSTSLKKVEKRQEELVNQVIKARYYEWLKPLILGILFVIGTLVSSWLFNLYWSKQIESNKKLLKQYQITKKQLLLIENYKGIKKVYRDGILIKKGYGVYLNKRLITIKKEK